MMTKLLKLVRPIVKKELEEANKNFPMFHSSHEAYATLKEEIEEAGEELTDTESLLGYFWLQVKDDDKNSDKLRTLNELKETAILCACESIQAAAMA